MVKKAKMKNKSKFFKWKAFKEKVMLLDRFRGTAIWPVFWSSHHGNCPGRNLWSYLIYLGSFCPLTLSLWPCSVYFINTVCGHSEDTISQIPHTTPTYKHPSIWGSESQWTAEVLSEEKKVKLIWVLVLMIWLLPNYISEKHSNPEMTTNSPLNFNSRDSWGFTDRK